MRYIGLKSTAIAVLSLVVIGGAASVAVAEDPAPAPAAAEPAVAPAEPAAAPAAADPAPAAEAPAAAPPATEPAAAATPAAGGDAPPFVGTWSADLTQCQNPQESESAPMIITTAGLDQHEVHCAFKDTKADGTTYKIAAECSVEGASEPHDMTFAVNGDKLIITDEAGANELNRCK
jgi:hypothetical protein